MQTTPQPQQGPQWLADVLLTPPWWLQAIVIMLAVLAALLAGYRLSQRGWEVDPVTQYSMLELTAVVVGVIAVVGALRSWASFPYWVDVVGGAFLGWFGTQVLIYVDEQRWFELDDPWALAYRWGLLLTGAVSISLLGLDGPTVIIGQGYVIMLGLGMVVYNASQQ